VNSATITLGIILLIPLVVLTVFKINAALVFMSACVGDVLVQFVSPDAKQFLALFQAHVPKGVDTGDNFVKILLLLLPVVLTSIFMIKTIHGNTKLLLNLLPAVGVSLLIGLLIVPLLPGSLSSNALNTQLWRQIKDAEDLIVGLSSLTCLLVLWSQRPKTGHKKDKHHKG
jgi:hypothetical protein